MEEVTGGSVDCCGITRPIAEKAYIHQQRSKVRDETRRDAAVWPGLDVGSNDSICPTAVFNSLVPQRSRCATARRGSFTLANVCAQLNRAAQKEAQIVFDLLELLREKLVCVAEHNQKKKQRNCAVSE